jgi:hypothetical protein
MKNHASYERYLIDYEDGVKEHRVVIERAICDVCDHTHAELPDVLVPYKSYSIIFILRVLKEYNHTHAVTSICRKYDISSSTLYGWRDLYLSHTSLDLGTIVEAALISVTRWLINPQDICRTEAPLDFFKHFGFSFMQYKKTTIFSSA